MNTYTCPLFYRIMVRLFKEQMKFGEYKKILNIKKCINNLEFNTNLKYLSTFRIMTKCVLDHKQNVLKIPKYTFNLLQIGKDLNAIIIESMLNDIIQILKKHDILCISTHYLICNTNQNIPQFIINCQRYNVPFFAILESLKAPYIQSPKDLYKQYWNNINDIFLNMVVTKIFK